MRPVHFVKYYDKGSTILGADQMAEALGERGLESRSLYPEQLAEIGDAVLIFIKTSRWHHLVAARLRGNATVLDVQDTPVFKKRIKNRALFDGLIFRSQRTMDDFGDGRRRTFKIYQQWNPRYRPNRVAGRGFRLGYLGDPRSYRYWGELDIPCVGEEGFFDESARFNCHISIRLEERERLYKPTCKIATAAACDANLITTRDAAALEVLGPDYPFYTDGDLPSVRRAIEFARESFDGPLWQAGLEKLRRVREEHSLERITDRYLDYLEQYEAA
jgi:hypothetical protein